VFQLPAKKASFSVLICFEDAFAGLARRFVQDGARLLINQTNDGWLDPSSASVQHLSHSVLRAVENRVPVVRAANTGISAFIDRDGHIYETIAMDEAGRPAAGIAMAGVNVPDQAMPLTLYTRYGDILFAIPCAIFTVGLLALALIRENKTLKRRPLH